MNQEWSCKVVECERDPVVRGLCGKHYRQLQLGIIDEDGDRLRSLARVPSWNGTLCSIQGCSEPARSRGWCNKHYLAYRSGVIDELGNSTGKQRFWHNKGYRTCTRGYIKVMAPESHPHADKDGYVLEHRLVMEKILGRFLEPREVVHHINGIRNDNRPENLQLRESREAHGHGHEDVKSVDRALDTLDKLCNPGMTNRELVLNRLGLLMQRLTLVV